MVGVVHGMPVHQIVRVTELRRVGLLQTVSVRGLQVVPTLEIHVGTLNVIQILMWRTDREMFLMLVPPCATFYLTDMVFIPDLLALQRAVIRGRQHSAVIRWLPEIIQAVLVIH